LGPVEVLGSSPEAHLARMVFRVRVRVTVRVLGLWLGLGLGLGLGLVLGLGLGHSRVLARCASGLDPKSFVFQLRSFAVLVVLCGRSFVVLCGPLWSFAPFALFSHTVNKNIEMRAYRSSRRNC